MLSPGSSITKQIETIKDDVFLPVISHDRRSGRDVRLWRMIRRKTMCVHVAKESCVVVCVRDYKRQRRKEAWRQRDMLWKFLDKAVHVLLLGG